ncbi:BTE_collapsed_G0027790.mRNA.1.CDS.1 [Saccharomyces cerevisiae]|nr:BTE_collapsed_G0027790.mRNA.1.CDS.1 [Saccharomyces cerevisiae]
MFKVTNKIAHFSSDSTKWMQPELQGKQELEGKFSCQAVQVKLAVTTGKDLGAVVVSGSSPLSTCKLVKWINFPYNPLLCPTWLILNPRK